MSKQKKISTVTQSVTQISNTPKIQSLTKVEDKVNTKTIKNVSIQGLELCLSTTNGPETIWLGPRKTVVVESTQITSQVETLHKRRLLQITNN